MCQSFYTLAASKTSDLLIQYYQIRSKISREQYYKLEADYKNPVLNSTFNTDIYTIVKQKMHNEKLSCIKNHEAKLNKCIKSQDKSMPYVKPSGNIPADNSSGTSIHTTTNTHAKTAKKRAQNIRKNTQDHPLIKDA